MTSGAPPRGDPAIDARIAERRAGVARDRQRRRRRRAASAALLVGLVAAAVAVASSPLFAITGIDVAGAAGVREQQVRDVLGFVEGDNLLRTDVGMAQAAVEDLPWVAAAEVVREPPATVHVRVESRVPFAVVRLANSSWILDADGVVLGGGVSDDAVVIDAPPDAALPPPGERTNDEGLRAALAFHAELPEEVAAMVERYRADSATDLRMELAPPGAAQRVWVRVGTGQQAGFKGDVVLALLEHAEDLLDGEGPGVESLDVRAPDNPVLVPRPGS